ncbi:MAG: Na+/H+ antiporter NhaA, partial [Gammaproteobacteria bacterium]|nr:Na+/H+ antiporter NhaA [Gammaproteobacteria bacterium]
MLLIGVTAAALILAHFPSAQKAYDWFAGHSDRHRYHSRPRHAGTAGLTIALARLLRIADLPPGPTWLQVYGIAAPCGVGFTMSPFVGTLPS